MTSISSLEGKRALVTGGSRGIGAAIVRRLASQGAAGAVLTQDGHLGATYELGGTPFTLTALAATISDVLGTRIAYQDMSVSDRTGVLTGSGLPPEMAAAGADADAGLARGELFTAGDDLVKLIGRPATTAREAIQNSAASLTGSHARLEAVGVVLGQLQPPPPAANASATRISPRSRSWSRGAGSPGMTLIKRGPGAGRKSSRSYDDDSSSQARGSQIQVGNGIVTHRIKIGLAMNSSSTVSAELGLRLVTTPQTIVPLTGSLFYSCQEPYAVRIAFHAGLEEPVEWIFARDLLSRGIQGRQGVGDVQVWPSPGPAGGEAGSVLNIELISPYGQARFETPAGEVTDFLRRAYQIVPDGQESGHIDLDAELTDQLRRAS